jgi:hypothetical protein
MEYLTFAEPTGFSPHRPLMIFRAAQYADLMHGPGMGLSWIRMSVRQEFLSERPRHESLFARFMDDWIRKVALDTAIANREMCEGRVYLKLPTRPDLLMQSIEQEMASEGVRMRRTTVLPGFSSKTLVNAWLARSNNVIQNSPLHPEGGAALAGMAAVMGVDENERFAEVLQAAQQRVAESYWSSSPDDTNSTSGDADAAKERLRQAIGQTVGVASDSTESIFAHIKVDPTAFEANSTTIRAQLRNIPLDPYMTTGTRLRLKTYRQIERLRKYADHLAAELARLDRIQQAVYEEVRIRRPRSRADAIEL